MAKARANCKCTKCGAEFTKIATKRNCTEANSWVAWAEKNITVCDDCRKAEYIAAEKEEAAKAAENVSSKVELPELEGSEKQISWAADIRAKMLDQMFSLGGASEQTMAIVRNFCSKQVSAKWWIDNRDLSMRGLAQAMMAAR